MNNIDVISVSANAYQLTWPYVDGINQLGHSTATKYNNAMEVQEFPLEIKSQAEARLIVRTQHIILVLTCLPVLYLISRLSDPNIIHKTNPIWSVIIDIIVYVLLCLSFVLSRFEALQMTLP